MSDNLISIIEDPYFGTIQAIQHFNHLISERANHFFNRSVNIIYTNHVAYEGDNILLKDNSLLDEGFFEIDGLLIPFVFELLNHSHKPVYKMDINLYLTVIYGNDHSKYLITTNIKNVLLDKTEAYLTAFSSRLPINLSKELKNVLENLYFYPFIDSINGKNLNIGYDVMTQSSYFYITHYQKISHLYDGRMLFSYDGRNFSMMMNGYKNIIVESENLDKAWGLLFSAIFKNQMYEESLLGPYTDMTSVLQDVDKISSIVEMVKY